MWTLCLWIIVTGASVCALAFLMMCYTGLCSLGQLQTTFPHGIVAYIQLQSHRKITFYYCVSQPSTRWCHSLFLASRLIPDDVMKSIAMHENMNWIECNEGEKKKNKARGNTKLTKEFKWSWTYKSFSLLKTFLLVFLISVIKCCTCKNVQKKHDFGVFNSFLWHFYLWWRIYIYIKNYIQNYNSEYFFAQIVN